MKILRSYGCVSVLALFGLFGCAGDMGSPSEPFQSGAGGAGGAGPQGGMAEMPVRCLPGDIQCSRGYEQLCDELGFWTNTGRRGDCEPDACADAEAADSYVGCEYLAVDLDNATQVWMGAFDIVGSATDGQPACNVQDPQSTRRDIGMCFSDSNGNGFLEPDEINAGPRSYCNIENQCRQGRLCEVLPWCVVEGRCPAQIDAEVRSDLDVCANSHHRAGTCDVGQACPAGFTCQQAASCVTDAQLSPFAIVVSNPSMDRVANVTVTSVTGMAIQRTVQPGTIEKIYPQQEGIPDQSLDFSGKQLKSYRVSSDQPIVAYQFNPLDNVKVFSNDGSLLIPVHAYDTIYYVLTLASVDRRPSNQPFNGYVAIVASEPGETRIRVTPSAGIEAGEASLSLEARVPVDFTLQQGEVLNLEAAESGDLTGTRIDSIDGATPFGVFVGHEAAGLVDSRGSGGGCCADHLEEQLFPASTWGRRFAIARTATRPDATRGGEPAADMLRILAQKPNTTVTFNPPPAAGNCPVLTAGQYCDVFIDYDTEVEGSNPILIGHLLLSAGNGQVGGNPLGDPGLAFAVPTEQFRDNYIFLTPDEYQEQFVAIVASEGTVVTLDGADVTGQLTPFGDGYAGGRIRLERGQHSVTCQSIDDSGCGVLVHGYSPAVSYLFAGGLDLKPITTP